MHTELRKLIKDRYDVADDVTRRAVRELIRALPSEDINVSAASKRDRFARWDDRISASHKKLMAWAKKELSESAYAELLAARVAYHVGIKVKVDKATLETLKWVGKARATESNRPILKLFSIEANITVCADGIQLRMIEHTNNFLPLPPGLYDLEFEGNTITAYRAPESWQFPDWKSSILPRKTDGDASLKLDTRNLPVFDNGATIRPNGANPWVITGEVEGYKALALMMPIDRAEPKPIMDWFIDQC